MTQFKKLQSMSIDEMAEFLDQYGMVDNTPWWKWWNSKYCDKCESVKATIQGFNRECEFAWCELEHKCRFFIEMDDIPDDKKIIKMWLKSETVDDELDELFALNDKRVDEMIEFEKGWE